MNYSDKIRGRLVEKLCKFAFGFFGSSRLKWSHAMIQEMHACRELRVYIFHVQMVGMVGRKLKTGPSSFPLLTRRPVQLSMSEAFDSCGSRHTVKGLPMAFIIIGEIFKLTHINP